MLDIAQNRKDRKYSRGVLLRRLLWSLLYYPLFRWTPRPLFGWRCWVLRRFGAKVGRHVHIYNTAVIYMPWNLEIGDWSAIGELAYLYNLGRVRIGERATISHRAHLCAGTHRYEDPSLPLLTPPIEIGSQAWICTDAFIGPGVCVGEGAVVGARAVVVKDVAPYQVVAGNPAKLVKIRRLSER